MYTVYYLSLVRTNTIHSLLFAPFSITSSWRIVLEINPMIGNKAFCFVLFCIFPTNYEPRTVIYSRCRIIPLFSSYFATSARTVAKTTEVCVNYSQLFRIEPGIKINTLGSNALLGASGRSYTLSGAPSSDQRAHQPFA